MLAVMQNSHKNIVMLAVSNGDSYIKVSNLLKTLPRMQAHGENHILSAKTLHTLNKSMSYMRKILWSFFIFSILHFFFKKSYLFKL